MHTRSPQRYVLIKLSLLLVFAGTWFAALQQDVSDPEIDVFRAVNELPGFLFWLLWPVMQLGALISFPLAAAGAALMRRLRLAAAFLVAGGGAYVIAKLVKDEVGRGRPGALLEEVILRGAHAGGGGYISGHAAVVTALAMVAHHYLPRRGRIVAWTLAALVAVARVYVGAHLPLDVIGGAALGGALGLLTVLIIHPDRAISRQATTGADHPDVQRRQVSRVR